MEVGCSPGDPSGHAGAVWLGSGKERLAAILWREAHGVRSFKEAVVPGQSESAGSDQRSYISFLRCHSIKVAEPRLEAPWCTCGVPQSRVRPYHRFDSLPCHLPGKRRHEQVCDPGGCHPGYYPGCAGVERGWRHRTQAGVYHMTLGSTPKGT